MKNKGIIILLIALAATIIVIVAWDFISKRPDKSHVNPYELDIYEYKQIDDSSLIQYTEIKNIRPDSGTLRGIAYSDNKIFILGNEFLQVITTGGNEIYRIPLMDSPRCITVSGKKIYIGYIDHVASYELNGRLIASWDTLSSKSVLTSLAVVNDQLFAADAGNRRVLHYNTNGDLISQFEGKSDTGQLHGFIIPSPCFDLAINAFGELWVVNPGKHALENYTYDGRLIGFWESASFNIEGFSGCCNPAQMAILPDGSFVTSEKGLVRIKVYKASGELLSVVAPTSSFANAFNAPDLAVTPEGDIYALDFDNSLIRVYRHN